MASARKANAMMAVGGVMIFVAVSSLLFLFGCQEWDEEAEGYWQRGVVDPRSAPLECCAVVCILLLVPLLIVAWALTHDWNVVVRRFKAWLRKRRRD